MTTLVFLHGWGASGSVWARQAAAFQERCAVLAPTIAVWEVNRLSRSLQTLPLAACTLVGWSLGGMLLLEALSERRMPPPAGLVLVGVAAAFCRRPDYPGGQPAGVVRAMRRALADDAAGVLAAFARRCLAPTEKVFQPQALAALAAPPHPENLAPGLDYLLRVDLRGRLDLIPGSPVIIQGEADAIVPPAQGHYLHERLPGSRLYLLPGAGHLPFLTQAEPFNRILEEVMAG